MKNSLNIAIAGLGTVGQGAVKIIHNNATLLAERCGKDINLIAVSARDKNKNRGINLDNIKWLDNPLDLVDLPEVDVIVELIGGANGVAKTLVESALKAGKSVVTANKALIAHHGIKLAKLAEENNVTLAYEAAVAGGIPIIKTLREGLAANKFSKIAGILNGTCNFILTSMGEDKKAFTQALKTAQEIGYAEADPSFDIDGIDTAHKLAIITSLAYACPLNTDFLIEGIRGINSLDIEYADQLGFVIKLLGVSTITPKGILQRVHPALVPKLSTIGRVSGAYNGIIVEGDFVGRITLEGAGAGEGATASSIVGDIIDIARGVIYKPFTVPVESIINLPIANIDDLEASYYIRLVVADKSGVLAAITSILGENGISMNSFLQNPHQTGESAQVVITTHKTVESAIKKALNSIIALETIIEKPQTIRIEDL